MLHHPIGDNGGKKEKQKQCSYLVFLLHISLTNDTVTESKFSKLVKLLQYHPNSTHSKYKYESKHTKGHYKCNNTNGITCIRHQCVEIGTKKKYLQVNSEMGLGVEVDAKWQQHKDLLHRRPFPDKTKFI